MNRTWIEPYPTDRGLELRLHKVRNGGWIVEQMGYDPDLKPLTLGAYSNEADMLRALQTALEAP